MPLRVIFLGTSASVPTKNRGQVSVALQRGGELLLFDAGEGVQRSIITAKLGFRKKMSVFISHIHGDHCLGLLGLLQSMDMMQRDALLSIYGPPGLEKFLKSNFESLKSNPTFPVEIHEIEEEGVISMGDGYDVFSCFSEHSTPTLSYMLQEHDRPGVFYPKKASQLRVPEGRLWSNLQRGKVVEVDGRKVLPDHVMGAKRKGRKIGISGDTRPTEKLRKFFQDCDLLMFDSTFTDDLTSKAIETFHSTSREAAKLARKAAVKKLILTHISARYNDTETLFQQAREEHQNVQVATDFLIVDVPYR